MKVQIPEKYIEEAISRYKHDTKKSSKKNDDKEPKKIITISRQQGTGGRIIAEELAKKLNITLWGKQILEVIADQSGWDYQAQMFDTLDEKAQNIIDAYISDFLGKAAKDSYFYLLPKAIYVIAQNNAIILGRGAHLQLPDAFTVHIKASFETRVKNMIKYEKMSETEAISRLTKNDKERDNFVKEFAKKTGIKERPYNFDLVINTDRYSTADASSILLHGFELYNKRYSPQQATEYPDN